MSDRLSAYLDAMGVEQWVLRSASNVDAEAEEPAHVATPAVLATASLADFPANTQGKYLVVCAPATQREGQGSAFEGAAAELLNAMLGATKWPPQQCVLLAGVEQLPLAIDSVKPAVVVAMGETASQALLQAGVKGISTHHPVQAQLDPKQFKRPIWEDLKLAMAEAS